MYVILPVHTQAYCFRKTKTYIFSLVSDTRSRWLISPGQPLPIFDHLPVHEEQPFQAIHCDLKDTNECFFLNKFLFWPERVGHDWDTLFSMLSCKCHVPRKTHFFILRHLPNQLNLNFIFTILPVMSTFLFSWNLYRWPPLTSLADIIMSISFQFLAVNQQLHLFLF